MRHRKETATSPRARWLVVPGLLTVLAWPAAGQSLLDRTPNVTGGWVGARNSVYFTFMHRFNNSGEPLRQVTNRPTFLLAYAPGFPVLIGAQYATRSDVVARIPNEWEAFARVRLLQEREGRPIEIAAQGAYNHAAESLDGELSAAARVGPLRVLGAARALQSGYGGDARFALAGGATLRLGNWFALAGDLGKLLDADSTEKAAWGLGIHIGIPLTPHTLSLQATNTNTATLQGASRGADEIRWGFEFTVPVTLARYFGRRGADSPPVVDPAAPPMALDSATRAVLVDSITRAMRLQYEARIREDSLRFALRGDSARLAQQLDSVRRMAREDSIRRETARRAAQDSAQRAQAAAPPRATVRAGMRNLAYEPARLTVAAGTTIIWRNNDQVEHTVTAADRSWDSGTIRPGATWQRTFTRPGTYEFFCTPHPFMKGTVVVRPAP